MAYRLDIFLYRLILQFFLVPFKFLIFFFLVCLSELWNVFYELIGKQGNERQHYDQYEAESGS